MGKVRTRFAPSPTGMMHIGNIRTALYEYLTARHNNGTFILRIEDTDRARFVAGATEEIISMLKWLNLNWDEGPIYQSERLDLYKKYSQELVDKGLSYEKEGAVWFKVPQEGEVSWIDIVGNKEITIKNSTQKDFVLLKSDGYPTYNFAVVVDDHLMEISPVIRGVEFISSTPKHIMLFQAFGWEVPQFAHLPLFLGSDRSKLSKRHGAQAASEFRKDGFLPEAILNYLALLSWTPPSGREILSLEEIVKEFDLKDVHITNAVFDYTKFEWMNGEYIRSLSDEELAQRLQEFLVDYPSKEKITPLIPLIKERIKKLSDFVPLTDFIFEKPEYDTLVFQKIKLLPGVEVKKVLEEILEVLKNLQSPWKKEKFEGELRGRAEKLGVKTAEFFQLLRVAVSGQLITPPLFETAEIIGEKETLLRIENVSKKYPNF